MCVPTGEIWVISLNNRTAGLENPRYCFLNLSTIHYTHTLTLDVMAERVLEVDVYEFLQKIQLEQFFDKIDKVLHLTRLSHFDHVAESDLCDINMSKPEQRRLFDAIRKYKKDRKKASKTRFSLRVSYMISCIILSNVNRMLCCLMYWHSNSLDWHVTILESFNFAWKIINAGSWIVELDKCEKAHWVIASMAIQAIFRVYIRSPASCV